MSGVTAYVVYLAVRVITDSLVYFVRSYHVYRPGHYLLERKLSFDSVAEITEFKIIVSCMQNSSNVKKDHVGVLSSL